MIRQEGKTFFPIIIIKKFIFTTEASKISLG